MKTAAKDKKPKLLDMELALVHYFGFRQNMIVPNISWGLFIHECDLLVVTSAGYAWEVEIKTSKADLKKDAEKPHQHRSNKIKRLYFAIPEHLGFCQNYIPARAGILVVCPGGYVKKEREAVESESPYQFTPDDRQQVGRLATMRIWTLKSRIREMRDAAEAKGIAKSSAQQAATRLKPGALMENGMHPVIGLNGEQI